MHLPFPMQWRQRGREKPIAKPIERYLNVKDLKAQLGPIPDDVAQVFVEAKEGIPGSWEYRLRIELGPQTWFIYVPVWPGLPGARPKDA